jgi:hypothetical protein
VLGGGGGVGDVAPYGALPRARAWRHANLPRCVVHLPRAHSTTHHGIMAPAPDLAADADDEAARCLLPYVRRRRVLAPCVRVGWVPDLTGRCCSFTGGEPRPGPNQHAQQRKSSPCVRDG